MQVRVPHIDSGTVAFVIVAAALLGVNLHLNAVNSRLARRVEAAEESVRVGLSASVGATPAAIQGYDINRARIQVEFANHQQPTVLLVFSPKCPACDEIWPVWTDFVGQISNKQWRVVAVDSTQLVDKSYLEGKLPSSATVVASPDAGSLIGFPLRLTPQMILVDRSGRITDIWTGAPRKLKGQWLQQIAHALGVSPRPAVIATALRLQ
jgi:hypothetical protein